MKKVDRVASDIKDWLVVFVEGQHAWVFSEPDERGLRQVYFDGKEEGRGVLLGVVIAPIGIGYINPSSDVETGQPLGIRFPDRPEEKCILMSTPVTAIIVPSS